MNEVGASEPLPHLERLLSAFNGGEGGSEGAYCTSTVAGNVSV